MSDSKLALAVLAVVAGIAAAALLCGMVAIAWIVAGTAVGFASAGFLAICLAVITWTVYEDLVLDGRVS